MATKKPVVWIIEDDDYFAKKYTERLTFARTVCFEDPFDAYSSGAAAPALILIDISAVAPIVSMHVHGAYSSIAQLGELHPGAIILIVSAVSKACLDDVADEVREVVDNVVEVFPWGSSRTHFDSVAEYIKQKL